MPAEPRPLPSPLLFIADAGLAADPAAQVERAVAGGASFIEVRRVRPDGGAPESGLRLEEIRRVLAAAGGARVLVNDRVDLALLAGAAGAHVGQDDLPVVAARRLLGPGRLLGLSTHDEAQFAAAQDLPLDYVALGPIFASTTKSGHAEIVGLERLAACAATSRLPVVAIGGIDERRFPAVLDAGASCVAVASAISRGSREGLAGRVASLLALAAAHRPLAAPASGAECIVLAGAPGSGKSSVGALLAERLGLPFIDLDRQVGAAELLARVGEDDFRFEEAAALRGLLAAGRRQVIALGGGTLLGEWSRLLLRRARARVLVLEVPAPECARRLTSSGATRPLAQAALAEGPAALEAHLRGRAEAARSFPGALPLDGMGTPEAVAERAARAVGPKMP